eukprot:GGOE01005843.1.p1 GENE.GGOE01005843.1~~GGOE01005843.1.p1  ORF type:complete len:100 (-),score=0.05 GGOE01005843.1:838-1137(-)
MPSIHCSPRQAVASCNSALWIEWVVAVPFWPHCRLNKAAASPAAFHLSTARPHQLHTIFLRESVAVLMKAERYMHMHTCTHSTTHRTYSRHKPYTQARH